VEIAQGWQFLTRREYAEAIDRAQFALRPRRLSPAALETLAIVAIASRWDAWRWTRSGVSIRAP